MDKEVIDYGNAIKEIADLITAGNIYGARQVAKSMPPRIKRKKIVNVSYNYNTGAKNTQARKYTYKDIMTVLIRDGFIDRYTNLRIVIPPALRVISEIIPLEFPYHRNWAEGKCHDSYWDLSATLDHLIPVANSGTDSLDNLITTSMSKNLQKNSISIEELGWSIYERNNLSNWDGLSNFFIEQCERNPGLLKVAYFRQWYNAAIDTITNKN